jgi:RHS repeat-associated protein
MRKYTILQSMSVEYFLSDHLGSTPITTNADGNKISEIRYKACPKGMLTLRVLWREDEVRHESGASPTEYTYTGQYSYTADFGLMFYNARWYDPSLGRFAQADMIVPPGVQGLDRYAAMNNNPVRYTDPSGHVPCDEDGVCSIGFHHNTKPQSATLSPTQIQKLLGFDKDEELTSWINAK